MCNRLVAAQAICLRRDPLEAGDAEFGHQGQPGVPLQPMTGGVLGFEFAHGFDRDPAVLQAHQPRRHPELEPVDAGANGPGCALDLVVGHEIVDHDRDPLVGLDLFAELADRGFENWAGGPAQVLVAMDTMCPC